MCNKIKVLLVLIKVKSATFLVLKSSQQIITKCLPSYKRKWLVVHLWAGAQGRKARVRLSDLKYLAFNQQL